MKKRDFIEKIATEKLTDLVNCNKQISILAILKNRDLI